MFQMWRGGGQSEAEGRVGAAREAAALGQKTYRVALVLLSGGALFNCVGSAQPQVQPLRYVGAACICAGALFVCAALARWLVTTHTHTVSTSPPQIYFPKILPYFDYIHIFIII